MRFIIFIGLILRELAIDLLFLSAFLLSIVMPIGAFVCFLFKDLTFPTYLVIIGGVESLILLYIFYKMFLVEMWRLAGELEKWRGNVK